MAWQPKPDGREHLDVPFRYSELQTALEWGMTPTQFDDLKDDDKAEMLAYGWAKNRMDAFRYEESERLAELKSKKNSAAAQRARR